MFLARLAVGVGEAGALPTSHSLIGDYFPPGARGRALGIFVMSGVVGYAAALMGGSQIASQFGWRSMFVIFGLSSLLTALLTVLVLREPRRMLPRTAQAPIDERYGPAITALLGKPSFRWQLAGTAFYGVANYGALIFVVSHLVRSFDMSLTRAGMIYGVISTVAAIAGALIGGYLTDRVARRGAAAVPLLTGLLSIAAVPAYFLALLTDDLTIFIAGMLLGGAMVFGAVPPLYAGFHIVCGSRRRATALAVASVMMSLIGLGGGPALTGILSDAFGAVYGSAFGLRIAMVIAIAALLPAAICFLAACRRIALDADD
jgi:MFS family permease